VPLHFLITYLKHFLDPAFKVLCCYHKPVYILFRNSAVFPADIHTVMHIFDKRRRHAHFIQPSYNLALGCRYNAMQLQVKDAEIDNSPTDVVGIFRFIPIFK
jgi:hypothetical protein